MFLLALVSPKKTVPPYLAAIFQLSQALTCDYFSRRQYHLFGPQSCRAHCLARALAQSLSCPCVPSSDAVAGYSSYRLSSHEEKKQRRTIVIERSHRVRENILIYTYFFQFHHRICHLFVVGSTAKGHTGRVSAPRLALYCAAHLTPFFFLRFSGWDTSRMFRARLYSALCILN